MSKYNIVFVFIFISSFLFSQNITYSKQIKTGDFQSTAFSIIQLDSMIYLSGFGLKNLTFYSHIFFY